MLLAKVRQEGLPLICCCRNPDLERRRVPQALSRFVDAYVPLIRFAAFGCAYALNTNKRAVFLKKLSGSRVSSTWSPNTLIHDA